MALREAASLQPAMNAQRPVRLLLDGLSPLMGAGLRVLLEPHTEHLMVLEDPDSAADVVLIDLGLERSVSAAVEAVKERGLPVVAFIPDGDLAAAFEARTVGARDTLWYSVGIERLLDVVVSIASGRPLTPPEGSAWHQDWRPAGLSTREAEVLGMVAAGKSNQEISQELYLSINTVKTYVRTAYRKIGAASRSQAVIWCLRHGLSSRTDSGAGLPRDRMGAPDGQSPRLA